MSNVTSAKPKREIRSLDSLVPFPHQSHFFDDLDEHDLSELANDIERNGLKHLIEILPENDAGLPPNTILCGHQRIRALKLLGEMESRVRVRCDLADATREEIDQIFLGDNFHRRQLDPLAKARVALRLFEIEKGRKAGTIKPHESTEARERVGKSLGMSGRNLDRYLHVLSTPIAIQNAFRRKELSLVEAAKVARLNTRDQKEMARRLNDGESVKDVVTALLQTNSTKPNRLPAFDRFMVSLEASCRDLQKLDPHAAKDVLMKGLPLLEQAHDLLGQWISRAKTR